MGCTGGVGNAPFTRPLATTAARQVTSWVEPPLQQLQRLRRQRPAQPCSAQGTPRLPGMGQACRPWGRKANKKLAAATGLLLSQNGKCQNGYGCLCLCLWLGLSLSLCLSVHGDLTPSQGYATNSATPNGSTLQPANHPSGASRCPKEFRPHTPDGPYTPSAERDKSLRKCLGTPHGQQTNMFPCTTIHPHH